MTAVHLLVMVWTLWLPNSNSDPMAIIHKNIGLIGCHLESEQWWYDKKYLEPHWHRGIHYGLLLDFVNSLA